MQSTLEGRFVRAEAGSDVTRLWSREGVGVVDGASMTRHSGDETEVGVRPNVVLAKYSLEAGRPEKLLGVQLVPLTFVRRKDDAVAERWWVHEKTGVVYKREMFGRDGDLVGLATLLEMHWGDPGPAEPFATDLDRAVEARTIDATDAPSALAGGYRLWRSYELEIDGRGAEQWVYSDGLHALSIFRLEGGGLERPAGFEAADLDGDRVWWGPGPGMWAWEGGGHSYLVVAEETAIDPAELIDPLPRGGPSVWARLGSVWSRLFRVMSGG